MDWHCWIPTVQRMSLRTFAYPLKDWTSSAQEPFSTILKTLRLTRKRSEHKNCDFDETCNTGRPSWVMNRGVGSSLVVPRSNYAIIFHRQLTWVYRWRSMVVSQTGNNQEPSSEEVNYLWDTPLFRLWWPKIRGNNLYIRARGGGEGANFWGEQQVPRAAGRREEQNKTKPMLARARVEGANKTKPRTKPTGCEPRGALAPRWRAFWKKLFAWQVVDRLGIHSQTRKTTLSRRAKSLD